MKKRRPRSILTIEDIRKIRFLLSEGKTREAIGKMFKVHHTTVTGIANGRTWRHVQ